MSSIGAAERKFVVDRKKIREWVQNESKIQNKVSSKNRGSFPKKLDGGVRKIIDMDLEEMLLEWLTLQRSKNLRVSRKFIQRKAMIYAEEKAASKGQMNDFGASEGWVEKFVSRNGLSLRRCTSQAQKPPKQIIDKEISYILYVRQLKQRNYYDFTTTYIVFSGHKRKVQNLKKDSAIKDRCYFESTINGWMNENTTIDWVKNILKTFTFGKRRLFA